MTGNTTPDFDSLTVDGAARAGSVQSTGLGVLTAGSAGSSNSVTISPRVTGSTPLISTTGPDAAIGLNVNLKGGGSFKVNGGPFEIAPPTQVLAGTSVPTLFNATEQYSGTTTNAAPVFNRLNITDAVDASASTAAIWGFSLQMTLNGTNGGRIAFISSLLQSLASTGNSGGEFQAGQFTVFPMFSEPGATTAAPLGTWVGLSSSAALRAIGNAQNIAQLASFEADVQRFAPNTVAQAAAVIIGVGGDVQGYVIDAGMWLQAGGGAPTHALRHGILYGGTQGCPVDATAGTYVGYATYSNPASARGTGAGKFGVDLEQVAFPATGNPYDGAFLRSRQYSVDGTGTTQIGTAYLTPSAAGVSIDAKGAIATAAAFAAGGTGYFSSTHAFTTQYGGLMTAVATGGVFSGTITVLAEPSFPSTTTPGNPVAIIDLWQNGTAGGSGATVNLTWNTTGNAVAIQPTAGGKLSFNGATPVVKPTGVAVTAAGIHAALVSIGLIAP